MKSVFEPAVREELLGRIELLSPASKPRWGKMTVGQMVKHCALCEEYYAGKITIPRSFLGKIVGKLAMNSILKNEDAAFPKNAQTRPAFKVVESIRDLESEKRKWKSLVEQYGSFSSDYFDHWFFGKMNRQQLGQFIYKHSDHHLKQFDC